MALREDIVSLMAKTLDVGVDELKLDQALYDSLGVDSTEMVELAVAIGKLAEIKLAQGDITNKHTPNQIVEIVEQKK